jgi:electron transport complex protein RnfB
VPVPAAPAQELVERLDAALPQTQCTRCGYPRCRDYAEALARGAADINRCPPGGATTIALLAGLLGVAAKELDPACGAPAPRRRAQIDESRCIGCRKCLDVCPTDAIVGARGWMHTVIAAQCTGCELCLPPCPVDCIALVPAEPSAPAGLWPDYARAEASEWRRRAEARLARLARAREAAPARRWTRPGVAPALREAPDPEQMRAEIRAARERVRRRRDHAPRGPYAR